MQHKKKGTMPEPSRSGLEDPTLCLFWEDESGNIIPSNWQGAVTQSVWAIWQEMCEKGQCLGPLTSIGWDVHQDFQECIESEYLWIHLCKDHWKADQIWINNFSNWRPKTSLQGVVVQLTNLKRE